MKLLFLDIDGVLNNSASCLARIGKLVATESQLTAFENIAKYVGNEDELPYGPTYTLMTIDPVAVGLVNRLLNKEPELYLVLSTSHRNFFASDNWAHRVDFGSPTHMMILATYMQVLGIKPYRIAGITPRLYQRRGLEVQKFLEDFDKAEEVTHHAAVDDEGSFKPIETTLVRTDARYGLTGDKYFELCQALNIDESPIIY